MRQDEAKEVSRGKVMRKNEAGGSKMREKEGK